MPHPLTAQINAAAQALPFASAVRVPHLVMIKAAIGPDSRPAIAWGDDPCIIEGLGQTSSRPAKHPLSHCGYRISKRSQWVSEV
jgi:hypothetical protein